ncbi:MAG: hypothetical protein ABW136_08005 [Steroidobacteraceae bacterium]
MKTLSYRLVGSLLAVAFASNASAADATCNRDCLAGVMTSYLQALVKHDPAELATTRNVKYTENGVRLALGDGLWQTASKLPVYRVDVIDEHQQSVGLIGRIDEGGNFNWYGVRLKVEPDRKVSEIEVLVNRSLTGGAGGGAPGAGAAATRVATDPNPLMMQVIPEAKRNTRTELAEAGDAYFTGIDTGTTSAGVPFDPKCQRRENGMTMASNENAEKGSMMWLDCKTQFDTGFQTIVTDIRERRFEVVDPVTGLAFGWGYFDHNGTVAKFSRTLDHAMVDVAPTFRQPSSFYIAEVFKVVDGKIRQIEAVLTTVPYQMESGW